MFESARLKIERANRHIRDLETQFGAFVQANPYRLVVETDPQTGEQDLQVKFGIELSPTFGLIIGDAIHNFRTALDHMAWELIGHDRGKQNRYTAFPAHHDRVSFEAACNGIETPSQSVRDLFKAMEAFPAGKGDSLYLIHLLDNSDKHSIITPMMRVVSIPDFSVINPDGSVLMRMRSSVYATGTRSALGLARVPNGCTVEVDKNAQPAFGIFFGGIQGFQMQPVFPALGKFRHAASDAIEIVARSII